MLKEQIEQAEAESEQGLISPLTVHLVVSGPVAGTLEKRLDLTGQNQIERFILEELSEVCSVLARQDGRNLDPAHVELIGTAWRFEGLLAGRHREMVHITRASEIGAGLASELREKGTRRPLLFTFARPKDAEQAGQELQLLLADALTSHRAHEAEREAKATQRIFRILRGYLRDRADLEARRGNAIRYVDRQVIGERIFFTTEIAQKDEIVGQDRVVEAAGGRSGGQVIAVSFNQVIMDVTFGDPNRVPRRGEITINTIAAQKALTHQTQALDTVVFDRSVSPNLKAIILNPRTASPAVAVTDLTITDPEFDEEKIDILAKALGVQDALAIEGPPGTGKTKLITEIVVQWLRRNPGDRILLSSQTHIALDNVLEKVAALDPSVKLIRIGRADDPKISRRAGNSYSTGGSTSG